MSVEWTEELKEQVVNDYKAANPTPETSTEIVKEIAESIGKTVNGVRAILVKAEVYVKKDATASKPGTKATTENKAPRTNKADAISALNTLITNNNLDLDDEITSKLTGKAAVYFAELITELTTREA